MLNLYDLLSDTERATEELEMMIKHNKYDKDLVFMGLLFNISACLASINKYLEDMNKNN